MHNSLPEIKQTTFIKPLIYWPYLYVSKYIAVQVAILWAS